MNVSKEELELLVEIERYLWNEDKNMSLYLRLHEFNEKLIQAREIRNKKAKIRIATKRKDNKMYARSKKEKEEKMKRRDNMNTNRIVKIYTLKNAFIKNSHHGNVADKQKIICVEYKDGTTRYIDLEGQLDITDVDYLEVTRKRGVTKTKTIYEERVYE